MIDIPFFKIDTIRPTNCCFLCSIFPKPDNMIELKWGWSFDDAKSSVYSVTDLQQISLDISLLLQNEFTATQKIIYSLLDNIRKYYKSKYIYFNSSPSNIYLFLPLNLN